MLTVRHEQMVVMRQSVRAAFAADVVAGLRTESPHAVLGLDDTEVAQRLCKALAHAERLHIDIERDLRAFIRLCFLVGADFAAHPPFSHGLDRAQGGSLNVLFEEAQPDDWERAAVRDVVDRYHEKTASTAHERNAGPASSRTAHAARVSLVPLNPAHAAALHRHGLHPDVWRLAGSLPSLDVDSVRAQIVDDGQAPDRHRFAVLDAASAFAGVLALEVQGGDLRLSYWIRRDRWGQGLATAAIGALLVALPPACAGRDRLVADVLEGNLPSMAVLRRHGFADDPGGSSPDVRRFMRAVPVPAPA